MNHLRSLTLAVLLGAASTAMAVKTQFWTHTTAEDFSTGTRTNLVVTNHGELKLSRELKSLLPANISFTVIAAMIETAPDVIVFATFPENQVYRLDNGKLETLATFENQTITAMAADAAGQIFVAVAGEKAELFKIAKPGDKPVSIFSQADVSYIWSILPAVGGEKGPMMLGVGTPARVIEVADKPKTIATLAGDNVLSLIVDKTGLLYAGTDTDGLVYKIKIGEKPTLLFDASEAEISSLAFDANGRLLVATGEAGEHISPIGNAVTGKPENAEPAGSTIPANKPAAPKSPEEKPAGDAIPAPALDAPDVPVADEPGVAEPPKKNTAGPVQPQNHENETAGNALYRIGDNGLVTELFRAPVVIYSMAVEGDAIYLATGETGDVHVIRPAAEENAVIAHTAAAQVTGILKSKSGKIYLATSNTGGISSLSANIAAEGSFESAALDAGVASQFGKLQLRGQLPEGSSMEVATRSGDSADADSGTWSDWSANQPAKEYVDVTSPAARYLQYKLTFKSKGQAVASLDEIRIAYQKPNIAPRVQSVTVAPDATVPGNRTITWEASDPNEDTLHYSIYARVLGRGGWVELAKDIEGNTHTWPGKQAADGRYEIKVVAADDADNQTGQGQHASRVSDTVVIDNTAPVIGDVKVDGTTVTLRVVDRNGVVAALDYALNSADHWQRRLPDDTIGDSPEERYTISLGKLASGQHTLTVRATDSEGNMSFETIGVSVP